MGNGTSNALTRVIERLESRFLLATALYGPDVSFGIGGHAGAPTASQMEFLPNGKIFTIGSRQDPDYHDDLLLITTVTRINADGTLDTTFGGGDGILDLDDEPRDLEATPSRFYLQTYGYNSRNVIHARKTADATYDTTFGGDGTVDIPSAIAMADEYDDISAFIIKALPDGTLYLDVSHEANDSPDYNERSRYRQIVKLKPNGDVDTAFGDDGFIVFDEEAADAQFGIFWTSHGLIRHTEAGGFREMTRYQANGTTVDTSFGTNGKVTLSDETFGFAEQDDGEILFFMAFPSTGPGGFAARLSRLNVNGSLDTAFGDNGVVTMQNSDWEGDAHAAFAHLDDQDRIVVVAGGRLYRFSPSGDLDTFPFDGSQAVDFHSFITDPQGRIITSSNGVTRYDTHAPIELGRDDVVYVTATAGDDEVTADAAGDQINVSLNDDLMPFDVEIVKGFTFYLQDGNNTARVSLDLPTTVTAGDGTDSITTAGGDDSISSGAGEDVITLGHGNDSVRIGRYENKTERHTITGGDGNKKIDVDGGAITVSLGVGDSTVNTSYQDGPNEITIAGGSNSVYLSGVDDRLTIGGNGANHVTLGGRGEQVVTTGDGPDSFLIYTSGTINSRGGNDYFGVTAHFDEENPLVIDAGDGDDHLEIALGPGYNHLVTAHGGNGNDYFWGGNGTQYFYGDAGNDTLRGNDGSDLLSGGGGNDRLQGENGNDRLYGGAGRDMIFGGRGNDRINGGGSPDLLYGQLGDDQLTGGGGNDRLNGGGGTDSLHGNAGNDFFIAKDDTADTLAGDNGADASINDSNDNRTSIESPNRTAPTVPQPPPITLTALGDSVDLTGNLGANAAVAGDGSFIIAGVVNGATKRAIQAQRYAADGSAQGDVITLGPTDILNDAYPSITVHVAIDADGDAVIAYTAPTNPSFSLFELSFVRISRNGVVSVPVVVAEGRINYHAVAMADDGSFFIGWTLYDEDYEHQTIQMRAYNTDGSPAANQFTAATPGDDGYISSLTMSARPNGSGVVFAFEEQGKYGSPFIRVGRADKTGTLGSLRDINRTAMKEPLRAQKPVLAAYVDGSFVLGYEGFSSDQTSQEVWALRFGRDFRVRGLPIELLPRPKTGNATVSASDLRLDTLPDGGFIATMRQWNGNNDTETLYAARFRPDGSTDPAALLAIDSHGPGRSFLSRAFGTARNGNAVAFYEDSAFADPGPAPNHFRRLVAT